MNNTPHHIVRGVTFVSMVSILFALVTSKVDDSS